MASVPRLRCAVYTRKSSEEGLEQDFNSLHAQREACEAFIRSQKHEGWVLIPAAYDDGGISGGTMDRPGLQQLLADIAARKIDVVVVYKVDRLTRSLADFARMVELFDQNQVSFVSVTQQFNTTSSMGRLTLNVLLSFAQFEREVTGERIRDKIKASKAKGMWMGGSVPLGYEVKDRKLLIQPEDADLVKLVYQLYLDLGTVRRLKGYLEQHDIRRRNNPYPWSGGMLYALLSNPIYVGKIVHKGVQHQGQHEALMDQHLWDQVQAKLTDNKNGKQGKHRVTEPCPLTGKLFDPQGRRMVPSHSQKRGRRYRYYISADLKSSAEDSGHGWRLPAKTIETAVVDTARDILLKAQIDHVADADTTTDQVALTIQQRLHLTQQLPTTAERLTTGEILSILIHRVDVAPDALTLTLDLSSLMLATDRPAGCFLSRHVIPVTLKRRHNELRLILKSPTARPSNIDQTLLRNIAKGHVWFRDWMSGQVGNLKDIADREGVSREYVADVVQLAFLSPKIVEAIAAGLQPIELNSRKLLAKNAIPLRWSEQAEQLLGR